MQTDDRSFGVLTLATSNDYLKAIGLALSLRVSNPGVPTAVACSKKIMPLLQPYFDYVLEERVDLHGFEHKVNLDRYSPFEVTFFFDSDVLVFRPVKPYVEHWGAPAYTAAGEYVTQGVSTFGFDRVAAMKKFGCKQMVKIEGVGHALFCKPACGPVFDLAREVTKNYKEYAGDIKYADEDALAIVMTLLNLAPSPYGDFIVRYVSAKPGTLEMDSSRGICRLIWVDNGLPLVPCMMHFAADEVPIAYTKELRRLFRANGVPTDGLTSMCLNDLWRSHIRPRIASRVRSMKRGFAKLR